MAATELYNKACEAANRGNFEYAIELFRQVLRLEPEYAGARVLLRGTERRRLAQMGRSLPKRILHRLIGLPALLAALASGFSPKRRVEWCEDYLRDNPGDARVLFMLGKACRKAGLKQSAVNVYKDVVALRPGKRGVLRELAALQEELGQMKDALGTYLLLYRLSPDDPDLEQKLRSVEAAEHLQSSGMEKAESYRDWLRDKDKAEALELGRWTDQSDAHRAQRIEQARSALEQDMANVTKITALAQLYEHEGDLDSAQNVLEEGLKRVPENFEIRELLGDIGLQKKEEGLHGLSRKLKADPQNETLRRQAEQLEAERKALARQEYQWRAEQHPTDHALKLKLGKALYELGELDAAIAALQFAARDKNLEGQTAKMLGLCFGAKGMHDLATEQYNRAVALHPEMDDAGLDVRYLLAQVLEGSGSLDEALKIYKNIYSHDITFRDVAQKVESLSK